MDLRAFRSAVAKLKKVGIIGGPGAPVNFPVDARSARPDSPVLRRAVKRWKDVIRDIAVPLKKTRLNLTIKEARKRNLQVVGSGPNARVIIPHFSGEKVKIKGRNIEYESVEGIRRLELPPVRTESLGLFFKDLKASNVKLPDKRRGELFAARFFTGRTQTFESLRELLNTLNVYDSVISAHGRKQTMEVIRNIEIFHMPEADQPVWAKLKREGKKRGKKRGKKK